MFTDKTIEIECQECGQKVIGVDMMASHIMDIHQDYSPADAVDFARIWGDNAHENAEAFERHYDEQRRLDKMIDADAFPQK